MGCLIGSIAPVIAIRAILQPLKVRQYSSCVSTFIYEQAATSWNGTALGLAQGNARQTIRDWIETSQLAIASPATMVIITGHNGKGTSRLLNNHLHNLTVMKIAVLFVSSGDRRKCRRAVTEKGPLGALLIGRSYKSELACVVILLLRDALVFRNFEKANPSSQRHKQGRGSYEGTRYDYTRQLTLDTHTTVWS